MIYQDEFIKLIMFFLCDRTKGEHTDSQGFKKELGGMFVNEERKKNKTRVYQRITETYALKTGCGGNLKKQEASVTWFVKVIEERRQAEMC